MPCLIVGTQVDLREDNAVKDKLSKQRMAPVKKEDGERMARELGAVKYVECSALTQYKLKDVFDEVGLLDDPTLPMMLTRTAGHCSRARTTGDKERRCREKEGQEMQHTLNRIKAAVKHDRTLGSVALHYFFD